MPRRRPAGRAAPWAPLRALALLALAGILLGGLAFSCTSLGAQTQEAALGSPAPDLPFPERVLLRTYLTLRRDALSAPSPQTTGGQFEIHPGESGATVAARLAQEGWVADPLILRLYFRYTGGDRRLLPGIYRIPANQTVRAIADGLTTGATRLRVLTVFPGWRREEIAQALDSLGLSTAAGDFIAATQRRPGTLDLYLEIPSEASLEGFLFPQTYEIDLAENSDLLVFRMADAFERAVGADIRAGLQARNLSLYQAVVLASIIQRETQAEDEMPTIASVYLNRLERGMPLGADPTLQYALGFSPDQQTWWRNPLGADELAIDSPYNTYTRKGLPPGPICSPSLAALSAVAGAPASPYLYFRAACDRPGRHVFAETYAQHLANACP